MAEIKQKYNLIQQLHFEKIKHRYFGLIQQFQTYQTELRNFLREDALRSQDMCVNTTYLVFDKNDFDECCSEKPNELKLLGYVTITTDAISLDRKLKDQFQSKGINYKYLPALKIGRLCVDDRYERRGIGRCILAFCIKIVHELNTYSACRFITLDAKRNCEKKKDSFHFYNSCGLNILIHKGKTRDELIKQSKGETPMYFDTYQILKKHLKLTTLE